MIQYDKDDELIKLVMKSSTSHYFMYRKKNGQHYRMYYDKDKEPLIMECSKWLMHM